MRRAPRSMNFVKVPSVATIAAPLFVTVAVTAAACGSRGPLDDYGPVVDAAAADVAPLDASDAATNADVVDAARPGGSIVGCGVCLLGQCGQGFLACAQDAACRQTFQCVVGSCLSGGSPDLTCLMKCASGDLSGAAQMLKIFQCVTATCGADCVPLIEGALGGLGGLGGSSGGTSGGTSGGPTRDAGPPRPRFSPFMQAVSRHWPALCSPEAQLSEPADPPQP